MQLKIQRSQRAGGMFGGTVLFCLDVRADYSQAETTNIGKYKLGNMLVYSSQAARRHMEKMGKHLDRVQSDSIREKASGLARGMISNAMAKMSLNVTIESLGRGHHIECKDLPELLSAEETFMQACRTLKTYFAAAATFSGTITLVDFDDEEKVHISQGALEFAALPAPRGDVTPALLAAPTAPIRFESFEDVRRFVTAKARELYEAYPERVLFGGIAAVGLVVLLYIIL
jgi:hypothetical protein